MIAHPTVLIDLAACAILVLIVVEDLRRFRIRNSRVLALIALFLTGGLLSGAGGSFVWHAVFALAALALMAGVFALGMVGAGDAKLIAAACLWIGPEGSLVFAVFLLGLSLLYCLGAGLGSVPARRRGGKLTIPFGPSIAGAWIATIVLLPS